MSVPGSVASAIGAAWTASVGFDLLLHGGLLAKLYVEPSPFLLAPEVAFRRIPLGYLAFLVLTAALAWMMIRLEVRGARRGFGFGASAGLVVWGSVALGLYSITTARPPLLVGWWLGQGVELGVAGAVLGDVASGTRPRRAWVKAGLFLVLCLVVTLAMQSFGWAPPMAVVGTFGN